MRGTLCIFNDTVLFTSVIPDLKFKWQMLDTDGDFGLNLLFKIIDVD